MTEYMQKLIEYSKKTAILNSNLALLSWDQEIYMPKEALEYRSEQQAYISGLVHKRILSPEYRKLLGDEIDLDSGIVRNKQLPDQYKTMLKEWHKEWVKKTCLPKEFVEKLAAHKSKSQHAWQIAREKNDFAYFSPYLEHMIGIMKEKARYINEKKDSYDVLMDEFEPDMTAGELKKIFADIKQFLVPFIQKIREVSKPFVNLTEHEFEPDKQMSYGLDIVKRLGFNFNKGRVDISTHPFTTDFHPSDVRITTRVSKTDIMENISSLIHETGHALYQQGLEQEWFGTPLCEPISLGIHESQSRLYENLIGKNILFWEAEYPRLQSLFPRQLGQIKLNDFYTSINQVKPGFIRVAADELTYNLHIVIRFEIEMAIFCDNISVGELPSLWNKKYEEYLGLVPPTDTLGILQDIHWSLGAFGYFPTYTLGNIIASQIYAVMIQENRNYLEEIKTGTYLSIREWLQKHVHKHGRFYTAEGLVKQITGEPMNTQYFIEYVKTKYGHIYDLQPGS